MLDIKNETLERLLQDYNLTEAPLNDGVQLLADKDHRYLRDLRINLNNALSYANLTKKESYLLALAVAINEKHENLKLTFSQLAAGEGATSEEITELFALVSLMNVNNIFYRFRHFTNKEYYNQTPAGIKMSIMMNPVLGKEFFELTSLAISAVNGCEMCVNAHEQSVMQHGATEARIYDAIRLTAVVKGFINLF
ncbi:carboxymuconolactone decarboxylase family protein [Adhaeribacter soli]|uniref:Alkyl hydroperoxide reductase AhpD n=1 Tax=Adhaeribacter soli TaxID=2607655 RepID=A0A5N1ITQ9_9BACT|nr:carboxymuconolactone decarboxylase family protein [Adhaeribacter soli]KAA9331746.1 alkylhydroperoxidase [Adhaeribacter soli]